MAAGCCLDVQRPSLALEALFARSMTARRFFFAQPCVLLVAVAERRGQAAGSMVVVCRQADIYRVRRRLSAAGTSIPSCETSRRRSRLDGSEQKHQPRNCRPNASRVQGPLRSLRPARSARRAQRPLFASTRVFVRRRQLRPQPRDLRGRMGGRDISPWICAEAVRRWLSSAEDDASSAEDDASAWDRSYK